MKNNPELQCSPGIWIADHHFSCHSIIRIRDENLREVGRTDCSHGDENEARHHADAAMMAASKDLYVNLQTMIDCMEAVNAEVLSTPINLDHIREAQAALKKARGEK